MDSILERHILLALAWIIFCFLHSLLASHRLKKWLQFRMRNKFIYYRAFYSVFALLSFTFIIFLLLETGSYLLFSGNWVSWIIGGMIGLTGIAIMVNSLKKYIFNVHGINRLIGKEKTELIETGIHAWVRHPLYLGTFLFIWGLWLILPFMSLLIVNLIVTIYTLIGIRFEEQKLELEFGEKYISYKQKTPMIIPGSGRKLP